MFESPRKDLKEKFRDRRATTNGFTVTSYHFRVRAGVVEHAADKAMIGGV